eukprot:4485093-Amphidinium_carterae.1
MPQRWASPQESAGTQKFRTASGEELFDAGGIKLTGHAERGQSPDEDAPDRGAQAARLSTSFAQEERCLHGQGRRSTFPTRQRARPEA